MRHLITGLVAAVAVMAAAPAMACGYTACAPQVYAPPVVAYTSSGCNPCGGSGWGYQRLAEPVQQYYYVNQGPTYSGPGAWAPAPVYREATVSGYRPYYGYSRPHHGYRSYRPWAPRVSHYHHRRMHHHHHGYAPRHAYAPRYAPHHGRHAPLRRYY